MENHQKLRKLYPLLSVISILMVIGLWISISSANPEILPTPHMVLDRYLLMLDRPIKKTSLLGHILASLSRVGTALIFAWVFGISFGILIGWNRTAKALFGTIFELFRPIPPIAWVPIVIMWFGVGEFPKLLIVFIGTIVPVVINTCAGIRMVDSINVDVGKMFGGNQRQILFEIVAPTAMPSIFAGIRTSVSTGWTVVLAAEMLAADKGLGFLVQRGMEGGDIPLVVLSIVCIGIVGVLLAVALNLAERWVCPWNVE